MLLRQFCDNLSHFSKVTLQNLFTYLFPLKMLNHFLSISSEFLT